jgi:hypothetical protein
MGALEFKDKSYYMAEKNTNSPHSHPSFANSKCNSLG